MKITAKTTKEQLVQFLGANAKAIREKDEDLFERIAYANKMLGKDESKVTKKDLVDLAKEAKKLLGDDVKSAEADTPEPEESKPKAENSVKAKPKKKAQKKAEPEASEDQKEDKKASKEEKPKKSLAKKKAKKEAKKSDEVTSDIFPESLKIEDNEYTLAHDVETMDNLYDELEKGNEIVFAFYWTKKHLKQYPYFNYTLGQPKSFENDLDLATTIYVSEERRIAYHVSLYTEGCYNTVPDDFEEVEGIRYAGAVEFQIYRLVK